MIEATIQPRFSETDALGHISNTALPIWFESARQKLFEELLDDFNLSEWPFIIAHISVDYIAQIFVNENVNIKIWITRIGSKSFTVYHEAFQNTRLVASGEAVVVGFNFKRQSSVEISEQHRKILTSHFLDKQPG